MISNGYYNIKTGKMIKAYSNGYFGFGLIMPVQSNAEIGVDENDAYLLAFNGTIENDNGEFVKVYNQIDKCFSSEVEWRFIEKTPEKILKKYEEEK